MLKFFKDWVSRRLAHKDRREILGHRAIRDLLAYQAMKF